MVEIKRKRGRPAKIKTFTETVREIAERKEGLADRLMASRKVPTVDDKLATLTKRVAKLEQILEDAVNAGRALHKKIETLSSVRHTGWQAHTAGESPVFAETVVEVLLRSGEKNGPYAAGNFLWRECGTGTIVAYKVV